MAKDRSPLEIKLGEVQPAVIVARLSDDSHRTFRPSPHTRKRWVGIIGSLAMLSWVQLELCDAKGQILEIYQNPDADLAPKSERQGVDVAQLSKSEIREMVLAQREALTWQHRGVEAALNTCLRVMEQMSEATQSVVEMYRTAERERKAMIRELEQALAARAGGGDELPSDGIVAALAPHLLGKLLGGAQVEPPPNGARRKVEG